MVPNSQTPSAATAGSLRAICCCTISQQQRFLSDCQQNTLKNVLSSTPSLCWTLLDKAEDIMSINPPLSLQRLSSRKMEGMESGAMLSPRCTDVAAQTGAPLGTLEGQHGIRSNFGRRKKHQRLCKPRARKEGPACPDSLQAHVCTHTCHRRGVVQAAQLLTHFGRRNIDKGEIPSCKPAVHGQEDLVQHSRMPIFAQGTDGECFQNNEGETRRPTIS
nr:uncharacterized protein LOC112989419 [Dromaius novaehollandiae]